MTPENLSTTATDAANRRTKIRVRPGEVICNLGVVLDLSAGGMRLLCTSRLDGRVTATIRTMFASVDITAKVAWAKRAGFRRHIVGLQFQNVDSATAATIARIATATPAGQTLWRQAV